MFFDDVQVLGDDTTKYPRILGEIPRAIPLPFQLMESVVLVRLEPQTGCKVDFKP